MNNAATKKTVSLELLSSDAFACKETILSAKTVAEGAREEILRLLSTDGRTSVDAVEDIILKADAFIRLTCEQLTQAHQLITAIDADVDAYWEALPDEGLEQLPRKGPTPSTEKAPPALTAIVQEGVQEGVQEADAAADTVDLFTLLGDICLCQQATQDAEALAENVFLELDRLVDPRQPQSIHAFSDGLTKTRALHVLMREKLGALSKELQGVQTDVSDFWEALPDGMDAQPRQPLAYLRHLERQAAPQSTSTRQRPKAPATSQRPTLASTLVKMRQAAGSLETMANWLACGYNKSSESRGSDIALVMINMEHPLSVLVDGSVAALDGMHVYEPAVTFDQCLTAMLELNTCQSVIAMLGELYWQLSVESEIDEPDSNAAANLASLAAAACRNAIKALTGPSDEPITERAVSNTVEFPVQMAPAQPEAAAEPGQPTPKSATRAKKAKAAGNVVAA